MKNDGSDNNKNLNNNIPQQDSDSGRSTESEKKVSQKTAWILAGSLAVLVIALVCAIVFGLNTGSSKENNAENPQETANAEEVKAEEPEEKEETPEPEPEPELPKGKVNVLLVGLDKSKARTDVIIVASYDLDNNTVKLLSVPRDTRIYYGGRYQKINGAYAYNKAGISGTIEAVTRLTGIPIDHYVEMNLDNFRTVVNSLDGVDFDVPSNMNYDDPAQNLHIHVSKGLQHLDGDKAEQVVRFRRYPEGDIARIRVQQKFIKALVAQKLYPELIQTLPVLFEIWNMKSSLTAENVKDYTEALSELDSENISTYILPGRAGTIGGASYWIADMNELKTLIEGEFEYDASAITVDAP